MSINREIDKTTLETCISHSQETCLSLLTEEMQMYINLVEKSVRKH